MRKILILLIGFLGAHFNVNAQAPNSIPVDLMISDATDRLVTLSPVGVRLRFRESGNTGIIAYEETHITSTNSLGQLRIEAGNGSTVIGQFSNLDWAATDYFLEIDVDPAGGTNYELNDTVPLKEIAKSQTTGRSGAIDQIDYGSIISTPVVISTTERNKLDNISITSGKDLDALTVDVVLNNDKLGFPGFGNTTGTVYERQWTAQEGNHYFNGGGVNLTNLSDVSNSGLKIDGNLNFSTRGFGSEPGTLLYDNTGTSSLLFYDQNGELKSIAAQSFITGSSNPNGDAFTNERLVIGDGFENFDDLPVDNQFIIQDGEPDILFDDTSNSSSFPNNDWSLSIDNDAEASFDIIDVSNNDTKVLKIQPQTPDNTLSVLNGGVNIGDSTAASRLSVDGSVSGLAFIGDAAGLLGLNASPTGSISNSGSTTIIADDDEDSNGAILFNTASTTRWVITAGGSFTNRSISTSILDVQGTLKADVVDVNRINLNGARIRNVETVSTLPSDYSDKDVILYNGADTSIFQIFLPAGREVTIINTGTDTISYNTLFTSLKPAGISGTINLENSDSVTFMGTSNGTVLKSLIQ